MGEYCVVVDFDENYICLCKGEAQSAYYSRSQVKLHPMVLLIKTGTLLIRDSVCIISNELKHDAMAVYEFMQVSFIHIENIYSESKKIHVWSDGAASQYISRAFDSNFSITCNYFG